jgi:hypothetical protein
MVAAGTGLAPFRGAIGDRVALIEAGAQIPSAICYFGCDARHLDYLDAEELEAAQAYGAVRIRPTFSRSPERHAAPHLERIRRRRNLVAAHGCRQPLRRRRVHQPGIGAGQ